MRFPRAILFDLDDTLAESFRPPTPEMIERLEHLLGLVPVAIVTGGGFGRIEKDFLSVMHHSDLSRLLLLPNSSSQCYLFKDGLWAKEYDLFLTPDERKIITETILETIENIPDFKDLQYCGTRVVDREAQIAYTAVGIDAPQEIKMKWDTDRSKRLYFCSILAPKLPNFDVMVGGASTIDITRKGINKAYGVQWISKHLGIPPSDMIFIGDGLTPGGNDAVVIPTGIQTRIVTGPGETTQVIDELLAHA